MACKKQFESKKCKKQLRDGDCPAKNYRDGTKCISPTGRDLKIPSTGNLISESISREIKKVVGQADQTLT